MLSVGTYMRRVSNKRKLIFEAIVDNPGSRRVDICRVLKMSMPLIYYHFSRLQAAGYIVSEDDNRRLYPCKSEGEYEFIP